MSDPSPLSPTAGGAPLRGRRLVVTRAATESRRLAERLVALGADVAEVPLITSAPPADDGRALDAAMADAVAGRIDWVVVSSPTGARRVVASLEGRTLAARVCAVGPGTAGVLEEAGVPVELVPERYVGEGLADAFPDASPQSPDDRRSTDTADSSGGTGASASPQGRVAIVRAAVARDVVPDRLAAKGWDVQVVEAYRTVPAPVDADGVEALRGADLATLTSSSTAEALADLVANHPGVEAPPVVCIGPVTAATASSRGLRSVAVAEPHSLDGLVAAVVAALAPGGGVTGSEDGVAGTGS